MGMTIDVLLYLANAICKIAFISYGWITMVRINAYIKEQTDGNKVEERKGEDT